MRAFRLALARNRIHYDGDGLLAGESPVEQCGGIIETLLAALVLLAEQHADGRGATAGRREYQAIASVACMPSLDANCTVVIMRWRQQLIGSIPRVLPVEWGAHFVNGRLDDLGE